MAIHLCLSGLSVQSLLAVEVKKMRKTFHSTADVRVTPFMSTTADVDTAIVNDFF